MPVGKMNWAEVWAAAAEYADFLSACQDAARRADLERAFKEVRLAAGDVKFLKALGRPVHILAIAEDWCGDVRRNLPVIARMCAEAPGNLRLKVTPVRADLMVRYLTNGAEAIPIIVFFNDVFVETGHWGPRPGECKRWMARAKACNQVDAARALIGDFYKKDKQRSTVRELRAQLEIATATAVEGT